MKWRLLVSTLVLSSGFALAEGPAHSGSATKTGTDRTVEEQKRKELLDKIAAKCSPVRPSPGVADALKGSQGNDRISAATDSGGQALFQKYCFECHQNGGSPGTIKDRSKGADFVIGKGKKMPPEGNPQPTNEEKQQIRAYLETTK